MENCDLVNNVIIDSGGVVVLIVFELYCFTGASFQLEYILQIM